MRRKIQFRIRKVAKQGDMRVIVVHKKYHEDFKKLGENKPFDIICQVLPVEGK